MCYNDFGDNMSMQKKIKSTNNNVEVENTNDELKKLIVLILVVTAFFFIFTTNIVGLIPIFPGGANVTGNINITLFLAVCTMLAINLFGNKEYWKEIFWPEVPLFLKAYPIPVMVNGSWIRSRTQSIQCNHASFHELLGSFGGIYSGICIYDVECSIHWLGS